MTTKQRATRPKKTATPADEPTPSELLAADAGPIEFPTGTPELVPLMMLPRRQRAEAMRAFGAFMNRHRDESSEIDDTGEIGGTLASVAIVVETAADCEDLLISAAKDKDEFTAWAAEASDSTILEAAIAYMRTYQPGEAPRSSS